MTRLQTALTIAGLITLAAPQARGAWAQPAAGAAADFHPTYGPPIAGVCVFSQAQALDQSTAGRSAARQLQGFAKTIQTELDAERSAIVSDDRALQAKKASLPAAQFKQDASALQQRATGFDARARTRSAQLQASRANASAQVVAVLTPVLASTISVHRCSLVIERGGVYGTSPAMDITAEVTRALDARLASVQLALSPPPASPASRP